MRNIIVMILIILLSTFIFVYYSNTMKSFDIKLIDFITLEAILAGPIFSVFLQKYFSEKTDEKNNQVYIYRTLMSAGSASNTSIKSIECFNLIETDYYNHTLVTLAYKKYLKLLRIRNTKNINNERRTK